MGGCGLLLLKFSINMREAQWLNVQIDPVQNQKLYS